MSFTNTDQPLKISKNKLKYSSSLTTNNLEDHQMIEVQFELREKDLTAFTEHQIKSKEDFQKIYRRHQIILPAILALLAFFLWFFFGNTLGAIIIGITAIAWHYISPWILKKNIRMKTLKHYSDHDKKNIVGDYKLRLEPRTLVQIKNSNETIYKLSEILRVESNPKYIFILLDMDLALVIPKRTCKGDLKSFIKQLDKRIQSS